MVGPDCPVSSGGAWPLSCKLFCARSIVSMETVASCFASAAPVTEDIVTAARLAVSPVGANSVVMPTVDTSRVERVASIIVTVRGATVLGDSKKA